MTPDHHEGTARKRLSPAEQDEQSRRRRAEVLALPMVPVRHQIPITSQSSGLSKLPSFTRPEDARAVAYQRLGHRLGAVTPGELAAVRRILRAFLDL